jgi:hypothetical protein
VSETLSTFIGSKPDVPANTTDAEFEESRIQLEQRMALVSGGLASSGLRAVPLGTEEIIELLYRSFNLGDMDNPIPYTQQ